MTINEKLVETLRWYQEMGIDVAVGDAPANHYAPLQSPPLKAASSVPAPSPPSSPSLSPPPFPAKEPSLASPPLPYPAVDLAGCQTLAELRGLIAAFEGCPLKKTAMNLVFADGNPQSQGYVGGRSSRSR